MTTIFQVIAVGLIAACSFSVDAASAKGGSVGTGGRVATPPPPRPVEAPAPRATTQAPPQNTTANISTSSNNLQPSFKSATSGSSANLSKANFPNINNRINAQRQSRHLKGTEQNTQNRGGYLNSNKDAQKVLDDFHAGKSQVIAKHRSGGPIVRNKSVTGYDNNLRMRRLDTPTHIFWIKGTKTVSVVPINPNFGKVTGE